MGLLLKNIKIPFQRRQTLTSSSKHMERFCFIVSITCQLGSVLGRREGRKGRSGVQEAVKEDRDNTVCKASKKH
jgi:hypothetical protein